MATRPEIVDQNFTRFVRDGNLPAPAAPGPRSPEEVGLRSTDLLDLFESQVMSRHLDLMARILREKGQGFYTIGSSDHEGMAALGKIFRTSDMAFLHYRSAAFFIQRSKAVPGSTILYDLLLSLTASSEDPIAGGAPQSSGE